MKLIIKESQKKQASSKIRELLVSKIVENTSSICDIEVYRISDDSNVSKKNIKIEIYILFSELFLSSSDIDTFQKFKETVENKIFKILRNIFGFEEKEINIGFAVEDC